MQYVGIATIGMFASSKTSIHIKNVLEKISQSSVWLLDG
jgi:hypothetical protein